MTLQQIHKKYLDAGADVIETNTFNAQRISQADYDMQAECYNINKAAATVCRFVSFFFFFSIS